MRAPARQASSDYPELVLSEVILPSMYVVSSQCDEGRHGTWVKNCTPALPYMCRSPWKEPRQPVKEKNGRGTGMGTLMPTCAAPQVLWSCRHSLYRELT